MRNDVVNLTDVWLVIVFIRSMYIATKDKVAEILGILPFNG